MAVELCAVSIEKKTEKKNKCVIHTEGVVMNRAGHKNVSILSNVLI